MEKEYTLVQTQENQMASANVKSVERVKLRKYQIKLPFFF